MSNLILNLRIGKIHFQISSAWKLSLSINDIHTWFARPFIQLHQLGDWPLENYKFKLKIKFFFGWFNFWAGFYFDRDLKILYFCPLPMICFKLRIDKIKLCQACKQPLSKMAHNTGDGWLLHWGCNNEICGCYYIDYYDEDEILEWPFEKETATAADFEAIGFVVV